VSPKSNRSGVSYDENDPRSLSMPEQRDGRPMPVVTRAQDMDAAREGLLADCPDEDLEVEQAHDDAVQEYLTGDGAGETLPPVTERPDYGTPEWTKARLNEELDRREIPHDPKANNPALIDLLEADDEHRAQHGDGAPPTGS
jgi:hypothetical protein